MGKQKRVDHKPGPNGVSMKRFKRVSDGRGTIYVASFVVSIGLITGCGDEASLPISAGFGPAPAIPAPRERIRQ